MGGGASKRTDESVVYSAYVRHTQGILVNGAGERLETALREGMSIKDWYVGMKERYGADTKDVILNIAGAIEAAAENMARDPSIGRMNSVLVVDGSHDIVFYIYISYFINKFFPDTVIQLTEGLNNDIRTRQIYALRRSLAPKNIIEYDRVFMPDYPFVHKGITSNNDLTVHLSGIMFGNVACYVLLSRMTDPPGLKYVKSWPQIDTPEPIPVIDTDVMEVDPEPIRPPVEPIATRTRSRSLNKKI